MYSYDLLLTIVEIKPMPSIKHLLFTSLYVILSLSYLSASNLSDHSSYEDKLQHIELLRSANLFDAAITEGEKLKKHVASFVDDKKACLLLAKCYFQNRNYKKVIGILGDGSDSYDSKVLLSMVYNEIQEYEKACTTLLDIYDGKGNDAAAFEWAFAKFYLKELDASKKAFCSLLNSKNEDFRFLSQLYLARHDLHACYYSQALGDLLELQNKLPKGHELTYELNYLLGQIYYQTKHYAKAVVAFENAIPKHGSQKGQWMNDVYHQLSLSYLKAANTINTEKNRTYLEREHLYRDLIAKKSKMNIFFAKSLYFKGLNDLTEGERLLEGKNPEATHAFLRSIKALEDAVEYFKEHDKLLSGYGLKYLAQAYAHQNTEDSLLQSFHILTSIINDPIILNDITDPDEIYYLHALVQSKLVEKNLEKYLFDNSLDAINMVLTHYPSGKFADLSLYLLATIHYKNKNFSQAERNFLKLAEDYPHSTLIPQSLYNAALSMENQNKNSEIIKALKKRVYTEFPLSKYADECYFLYYSYSDYIHGDRAAIKHLECFPKLFVNSPWVLNAYYLLGMDHKRDRKTAEGKWIRKKNLNVAIQYFQLVESSFEEFFKQDRISEEKLDYYLQIRYLSILERGLANLQIAEESTTTKRQIHLEYAQHVFLQIIEDFKSTSSAFVKLMLNQDPIPRFQEESSYWLAVSYRQANNHDAAVKVLKEMYENYNQLKITRGYFLSRVLYELGLIYLVDAKFDLSLLNFLKAEDAAKGKILNSEQKLDLWIQQSLALKGLKKFDDAILILSKVINDDTISAQRVKAMFMRAENYEAQGRKELSKRQLEATSKKGGEWALKAKNKLQNEET
jgi:TolA-binding protein